MANLTITIEDEALKRARIKALEHGTSVNALLRDYLENYAGVRDRQQQAARTILKLSARARSGRRGEAWTRDELHERHL
jgi:plasmid stability protein